MPEYLTDMDRLPSREELVSMLKATDNKRNQVIVSLLYFTGARPSELLELEKKDFLVTETYIKIKVPTKKKKTGGKWSLKYREIQLARGFGKDKDNLIELIAWYVQRAEEGIMFPMTTRNLHYIVNTLAKKGLNRRGCPYLFRHNRLTMQATKGATVEELMYFKGASDIRSVSPYLHGKPVKVR